MILVASQEVRKGVFDDCFEDRSDFGGFAGGSKGVFDDCFEDRGDSVVPKEVRRLRLTTVSRIARWIWGLGTWENYPPRDLRVILGGKFTPQGI